MTSPAYQQKSLAAAYRYCAALSRAHAENFPVASVILPQRLRPAVSAIYAFSRVADDFADEAEFAGARLERLQEWERFLLDPHPTHPIFVALHDARLRHNLSLPLFQRLLLAFKQDVQKSRYENFLEVLAYCENSANPVGRLMLELFGEANAERNAWSDAICTALQLTNFWQDVAIDLQKDRIYLPQEDLLRFGIAVGAGSKPAPNWGQVLNLPLRDQIARTREFFYRGHALGLDLGGRLGIEIRLTWLTGMKILEKIIANDCDVFNHRPTLSKKDFITLFLVALSRREYARRGCI